MQKFYLHQKNNQIFTKVSNGHFSVFESAFEVGDGSWKLETCYVGDNMLMTHLIYFKNVTFIKSSTKICRQHHCSLVTFFHHQYVTVEFSCSSIHLCPEMFQRWFNQPQNHFIIIVTLCSCEKIQSNTTISIVSRRNIFNKIWEKFQKKNFKNNFKKKFWKKFLGNFII